MGKMAIKTVKISLETGKVPGKIQDFIMSKALNQAKVVCWLYNEVLFGELRDQNLMFWDGKSPDLDRYMMEIRIFDTDQELRVWRAGQEFHYRFVQDSGEKDAEVVDAELVMYGTRYRDKNDEFIEVTEDQGVSYVIPKQWLDGVLDKKHRLLLKTRNYIGYNGLGQAGYTDSRFVDIHVMEG